MDWATKRKITVLSMIAAVIFVGSAFVLFFLLYNQPTCSDGVQNQNETGIDCGGVCVAVCPDTASEPLVLWERTFPAHEGNFNLVAYVENPNLTSRVASASYQFKIYDEDNVLLDTISGTTSIPPNQLFAVFEGPHPLDRAPARTTFRFTSDLPWLSAPDRDPDSILVENRSFSSLETRPRVQADFTNTTIDTIEGIEAIAIVYDSDNIAIGTSRTVINRLESGETVQKTFTWPEPFSAGIRECQHPADTMLVIDRSGSMNDDNDDPPQPLSAVKESAKLFLDRLAGTDKAGVVSFASEASDPIDMPLTTDTDQAKAAIDSIAIEPPDGEQHTNIADGIAQALTELSSARRSSDATGVITLLTDGIATRPLPPDGSDESSDEYPEQQALARASEAEQSDIPLYVIGLGDQVDGDFLSELATSPAHYFFSPSTDELDQIYQDVAVSICEKGPAVVRILTRVLSN